MVGFQFADYIYQQPQNARNDKCSSISSCHMISADNSELSLRDGGLICTNGRLNLYCFD